MSAAPAICSKPACAWRQARHRFVVSGAAYGYHADNPEWLTEADPVRGNQSFAYSWHKRLVEEMLAEYRASQPQLEQIVFRIGTILGATVHNQITDLFEKPRLIAIAAPTAPSSSSTTRTWSAPSCKASIRR
jgi:UDP-glucose 4-epimerase